MKKYIAFCVMGIALMCSSIPAFAQLDQTPEFVMETNLKKPFPTVWKAIHKALEGINCRNNHNI